MMDWEDSENLEQLLKATRQGDETTARLLRLVLEKQDQTLEAFNRMAAGLDRLAQAVEGLRTDITPPLDKPGRLPPPAVKKGNAP
jgi:hypothetical protein